MKYRKLPAVIEAFEWRHDLPASHTPEWFFEGCRSRKCIPQFDGKVAIHTLEGIMLADRGDFIIRGIQGEIYPCKPHIFAATYESASEPVSGAEE